MKKIDISELCFVNSGIGKLVEEDDNKVRFESFLPTTDFKEYITSSLLGERQSVVLGRNGAYTEVEFTKEQRRDFQYEVDKAFSMSDSDLIDRVRVKCYRGDF